MKSIKELYYEFTDVLNYKNQIKILRKQVEELKKEPQQLIDKMNLMKWEIRIFFHNKLYDITKKK